MQNHYKRIHEKIKENHKCYICPKYYETKSGLNEHVKTIHTNEKPHRCDKCDMAFVHASYLKMHQKVDHDGERYNCELCSAQYKSRESKNTD